MNKNLTSDRRVSDTCSSDASTRKRKVSVLIPAYNEQEVIPELYSRMKALMDSNPNYDWEVLLVNDGSSDNTLPLLSKMHADDPRFRYIDLSRNFGKETAMMAGFDYVTGDCMVIMDADLQHPPETIPAMLAEWENGYDDVYGQRLTRGRESILRKKLSLLYYRLLHKVSDSPVMENTGDFRLLDRSCIDALVKMRECHRYTKGMYCYIGFRKKGVPFEQADRQTGESKFNFFRLFRLGLEGLTSHTTMPLRIATVLGTVVSLLAVAYALYIFIKTIVVGEPVAGFPTLMITLLFLGGIVLITLGIIGEYLGRVFDEVKHRPVYFIREIDGKKPTLKNDEHDNN